MLETSRTKISLHSELSGSRSFDAADHKSKGIANKLLSPLHQRILLILNQSEVLSPVHVDVKNDSYWYLMRRKMGAKKHMSLIVEQNKTTSRWDSYIYKMKPREEDLAMVPQKQFLTSHSSRWGAIKKCDAACRDRDANPFENTKLTSAVDVNKIASTHFSITIVSKAFDRLSYTERLALVYSELVLYMGINCIPNSYLKDLNSIVYKCAPTKFRKITYLGTNSCQLNIFRFIPFDSPVSLSIDARTPSQWKLGQYASPISERYGSAHTTLLASHVTPSSLPKAQKKRVRKLAGLPSVAPPPSASGHTKKKESSYNKSDSKSESFTPGQIPLEPIKPTSPSVTPSQGLKGGGIYGHFFDDLPPNVKALAMESYVHNKQLIRNEGYQQPASARSSTSKSFYPKTTMSALRAKAESEVIHSEYDKGTHTEMEMLEEVYIANKMIERIVIRMQRIYRRYKLIRAVRLIWKRELAILMIQKVVRGTFGRNYTKLLQQLRPLAATRIQQCFRRYRGKMFRKAWQALVYRATRVIFPIMKRFISHCVRQSYRKYQKAATVIQSIARMYLGRVHYYKRCGESNFINRLYPYAILVLQRAARGYLAKKRVGALWNALLIEKIDKPATLLLQRIFRGKRGRTIAKKLRKRRAAANFLQRWIRVTLRRRWLVSRYNYVM